MMIANRKVELLLVLAGTFTCQGLAPAPTSSRRDALGWMGGAACAAIVTSTTQQPAWAAVGAQESVNVDNFLRTGMDAGGNMGVSSQAGKSRPRTGVVLR
jgi:hypothetical protein